MPLELPRLRDVPGLCDALRWLLGHRGGATSDRNMLVKARLCGLITADSQVNWKADGRVANRLAAAALRRLPCDPQKLGRILYGLGEINARGTTELAPLLTRHLARRRTRLSFLKALDAAAAFDSKRSIKPQLSAIDFVQWISSAPLAWHTFARAVHRIGHPDFLLGAGRYGLGFAAQIIAVVDPRAIDAWIARHPNRLRVAIIGSAVLPTMFDSDCSPVPPCFSGAAFRPSNPLRRRCMSARYSRCRRSQAFATAAEHLSKTASIPETRPG